MELLPEEAGDEAEKQKTRGHQNTRVVGETSRNVFDIRYIQKSLGQC